MPTTYQTASQAIQDRAYDAMARYHPHLRDAKVRLTVLEASGPRDADGEVCGPAIKVRGQKAMACIKVTSLKDRAAGLGDAVLIIDADECDTWSDATWDALLDHELTHLELCTDKHGKLIRDDLGRPKLRMRHHDYEIGGFHEVADRHKGEAVEVQAVQKIGGEMVRQGVLNGF